MAKSNKSSSQCTNSSNKEEETKKLRKNKSGIITKSRKSKRTKLKQFGDKIKEIVRKRKRSLRSESSLLILKRKATSIITKRIENKDKSKTTDANKSKRNNNKNSGKIKTTPKTSSDKQKTFKKNLRGMTKKITKKTKLGQSNLTPKNEIELICTNGKPIIEISPKNIVPGSVLKKIQSTPKKLKCKTPLKFDFVPYIDQIIEEMTATSKVHKKQETLLEKDFSDNSSDEEYQPNEDELNDLDDTFHEEKSQTEEQEIKEQSKYLADEDDEESQSFIEDKVFYRTRSKVSYMDTPLEDIEQAFVPPDIDKDMYELLIDDQDWNEFLTEFTKPIDKINEEDDDTEFIPNDEDIIDSEELRRDPGVKVSKKELNELMGELFEINEIYDYHDQEPQQDNINDYVNSTFNEVINSTNTTELNTDTNNSQNIDCNLGKNKSIIKNNQKENSNTEINVQKKVQFKNGDQNEIDKIKSCGVQNEKNQHLKNNDHHEENVKESEENNEDLKNNENVVRETAENNEKIKNNDLIENNEKETKTTNTSGGLRGKELGELFDAYVHGIELFKKRYKIINEDELNYHDQVLQYGKYVFENEMKKRKQNTSNTSKSNNTNQNMRNISEKVTHEMNETNLKSNNSNEIVNLNEKNQRLSTSFTSSKDNTEENTDKTVEISTTKAIHIDSNENNRNNILNENQAVKFNQTIENISTTCDNENENIKTMGTLHKLFGRSSQRNDRIEETNKDNIMENKIIQNELNYDTSISISEKHFHQIENSKQNVIESNSNICVNKIDINHLQDKINERWIINKDNNEIQDSKSSNTCIDANRTARDQYDKQFQDIRKHGNDFILNDNNIGNNSHNIVLENDDLKLLKQQISQHIQYSLQHYLQTYNHPRLFRLSNKFRTMIEIFYKLSSNNNQSNFNCLNIKSAMELIETYENMHQCDTFKNYMNNQWNQCIDRWKYYKNNSLELPLPLINIILSNKSFIYPLILPNKTFNSKDRHLNLNIELNNEINLLIYGLINYSKLLYKNSKFKINKQNILIDILTLIKSNYIPIHNVNNIATKMYALLKSNKNNNLKRFFEFGIVEEVNHFIIDYNDNNILAPNQQHLQLLPSNWREYSNKR